MTRMSRRNYGQFCGLAHALDVVGERWSLLIVRELSTGPKRYNQLADALAGIGTSLLASRVRQLEADGVVTRRLLLDQPSSAVAYELTDVGRELAAAMVPLAVWGARHQMTDVDADDEMFRAEWALNFLIAGSDESVSDVDAVYGFHIGDSVAHLLVRKGRMSARAGTAPDGADVTIRMSRDIVASIVGQRTTVAEAIADGRIDVEGATDEVACLATVVDGRIRNRLFS